jgi:hypothetical protein
LPKLRKSCRSRWMLRSPRCDKARMRVCYNSRLGA